MALRHLLLFLSPIILFSAPIDYRACQLKYEVSSLQVGDTQGFAIDEKYALVYSEDIPKQKVVKRDPFLGLNLIESPKPFKHKFQFYKQRPKRVAAVLPKEVIEGKMISEQVGLNHFAQFSQSIKSNSLISGPCCGILGLSTPKGVIEKEYIQHFLESKEISYSDMGIRLSEEKGIRVVEINPFFKDSPFMLDDVILEMDGKKAASAGQISRDILFSKIGSIHSFLVLRDGKKSKLNATGEKRLSGALIPDSFFDLFGLKLDEDLFVKEDAPKYEIKKGDRLLLIMGKEVKTLKEIRHLLSLEKNSKNELIVLLFKREGFDFFIHFPKP